MQRLFKNKDHVYNECKWFPVNPTTKAKVSEPEINFSFGKAVFNFASMKPIIVYLYESAQKD